MPAQVDHLVVAAASLAEGVAWCESTLGISPGPGGEHPLMGTHNRLLTLASPAFPQTYLEIIAIRGAIDSVAASARPDWAKRWFDLDDEALQQHLQASGPQLVHFVASTPHAGAAVQALAGLGIDRGEVLEASRMTPQGLLQWKITVRSDGQRLFNGTLPTLIEWGDTAHTAHPTQGMAASGLSLLSLQASQPDPSGLRAAYDAMGLASVRVVQGAPQLRASLQTPRGRVVLESGGV